MSAFWKTVTCLWELSSDTNYLSLLSRQVRARDYVVNDLLWDDQRPWGEWEDEASLEQQQGCPTMSTAGHLGNLLTLDEDSDHMLCPNEHQFGESLRAFNNTKISVSAKTM
jgi:hypothetical protein